MKRNIALIGVFMILLVAFLIMTKTKKKSERSHIPTNLIEADSARISRIEVKRSSDTEPIVLEKRGAEWYLTKPIEYPANLTNVEMILGKISSTKVMAQISSNPEKQSQFRVDSTGVSLKIYEEDDLKVDIIVGKAGRGGLTYIRPPSAQEVYSVDNLPSYMLNRRVKDWRDMTITKFEKEELQSLKLVQGDEEIALTRRPGDPDAWDLIRSGDDQVYYAKKARMDQIVNGLWKFNAQDFKDAPDSAAVAKFSEPDSTVTVALMDNTQWTLHFEREDAKGNRYLVKREDKGDGVYFMTNKGVIKNLFPLFNDLKEEPPPEQGPGLPDSLKIEMDMQP
ncbi:MAG: hypothetical protein B6244_11705 [Candidatus Cloacimonetes bacterium 4572_55]|nr:MAG: hypothetical protein B6244_11705 [Candidatus Cloacimonetes bacterium 4572_55]